MSRGGPNYALQRTGTDKVPGRGRLAIMPIEINLAREPMQSRAVAERGR
jgi:hypothetical protein